MPDPWVLPNLTIARITDKSIHIIKTNPFYQPPPYGSPYVAHCLRVSLYSYVGNAWPKSLTILTVTLVTHNCIHKIWIPTFYLNCSELPISKVPGPLHRPGMSYAPNAWSPSWVHRQQHTANILLSALGFYICTWFLRPRVLYPALGPKMYLVLDYQLYR